MNTGKAMIMMRVQIRTRLLLLLAFMLLIVLFGGLIYVSISKYSYQDFYYLLEIRAVAAAKAKFHNVDSEPASEALFELFEKFPSEMDYFIPVSDNADGYKEYLNEIGVPIEFIQSIIRNREAQYNNKDEFYKGIVYSTANGDYIVIVKALNQYDALHISYLRKVFMIAVLIAITFSVLISQYLSRRIFFPLHEVTNKVRQISSESLNLRLPALSGNNEMARLTETFNEMLDRIETSFETQNNFISNASHELRTPLTAIMGEAEVTLSKQRTEAEYIETLKVILDEAEKLEKKTQALLFLAQTGFNDKVLKTEKVRIDQLLWDVKETIIKIAPDSKVLLDLSLLPENPMKLKVAGNTQLLHLAISNIISNACKYSDNKPVTVSFGSVDDRIVIVIKDKGVGIPQNELKYIYDPFFRASNTKRFEGYGIGLPLARNIIRMHKGELNVSSIENEGTTVQIILPVGQFQV